MTKTATTLFSTLLAIFCIISTVALAQEKVEGTININTATVEELTLLPGIGPSKAEAIVNSRDKKPFKKIEGIIRIKGIGRKTFLRLRPFLTIEGKTTLKKASSPQKQK